KAEVSVVAAREASGSAGRNQDSKWLEAYGKLPLSFEENVGQTAQEVRYVSHGAGYELFLTPQEAVLSLRDPATYDLSPRHRFKTMRALREASRARMMTAVRMRFEGANPAAQISATDRLLKKTNYFVGGDPKKWHANVPSYARVKYAEIYPGVDLVFYGNQRRLEYDFVVAPGADPTAIRLALEGARKLRISAHGDVVLNVAGGEVVLQKPIIYQMHKGERHEIAGRYILTKGHQVSFSVASYDRSEPLILDPVLNYSTYLGGSSNEGGGGSQSFGIAVDANGNAFVAGTTFSNDFPTTTSGKIGFDPGPPKSGGAAGAVFVTEMNPTGTAEVYSTYLAGSTGEFGVALALDPTGKIYVTGLTFSNDFPTTDGTIAGTLAGFKQSPNPTNLNVGTSFISKIDPSISGTGSLVYSSYIGGTGGSASLADFGNAIAADASGNAYVTGITLSPANPGPVFAKTDFPVKNAFQPAPSDIANGNAFLTRIDTTQAGNASLIYSTYLGGAGAHAVNLGFADAGFGVAVDSSSNAYIVGATSSTDFPTNGTLAANQPTSPAGNTQGTAFVARIDTTKSGSASLAYSTYLGGQTQDLGFGIALGPNNVAYVTGTTNSTNFPTMPAGAFQTTNNASGGTAFVTLIDTGVAGGASLKYSTYLGGASNDVGGGIRADGAGNAYVVGATGSIGFPITAGALQPSYPGGQSDGFVSKLNPAGGGASDLLYSTFFGGNGAGHDQVFSVAVDTANPPNVFITGETFSSPAPTGNFPIFPSTAFQTTLKGTSDAFIAKLSLIPTLAISPTSLAFGVQPVGITSVPKTVTLTNNTSDPIPFPGASVSFSGSNAADFSSPSNTCGASIAAGVSCTVGVTFTPSVASGESATLVITVVITNGGVSGSQSFDVSLSGTGSAAAPGVALSVTSLTFGGQLLTTTSASKPVTLTNNGNAALTINSIAASGNFAQTNTCPVSPATLAASGTCTISVTFAPTAVGARTGTLTITDNAGGSPHTVSLTGTGWDFTLTAPATVTVKKGATGSFNVTITPLGGFNQAVTVTCTGTTMPVTCTPVSPVTPADGVTPVTSAVSISAIGMILPPPSRPTPPMSMRQIVPLLLALSLLMCLFRTRRLQTRLGMVTAIIVLLALAGCGDDSKVKKGTTNLTITASSGGVSKTATVALTIN
ncbi:MAG: choice-of-anchor D domain-containing protein, partial [Candidatus Acidiferrum sp.]